jgi:hypothetical protein
VGIREALDRLVAGVQQVPHVYRPSIETFAELDVQKVAQELGLEVLGSGDGDNQKSTKNTRALKNGSILAQWMGRASN